MSTEERKEAVVAEDSIPSEVESPSSTTKKSEDEVLFPEIEIDGFIIRPWTLGKLRRINPHIESIFVRLREKDIKLSVSNIEQHLMDLYFAAIPQVMAILAISLDCKEEKLEDVPIPKAIRLIYLVFKQNEESIKNVLNLLQLAKS